MALEVGLRHATEQDLPFATALAGDQAVEPFLAPGAGDELGLRELIDQSPLGLYVIEVDGGELAGALALALVSERSRLCQLSRLMVSPQRQGAGVAAEAVRLACRVALLDNGLHRIQAEAYGDNVPSQRVFERVGFTREGVRRRAYRRRERWLDGVIYGLLAEELPAGGYTGAGPGRAN